MDSSIYEVSGDPLGAHRLVVGMPGHAKPLQDAVRDRFLAPPSGRAKSDDFFLTAWSEDPAPEREQEIYTARVQGQPGASVCFAYLTSSEAGPQDNINRIVVIDGPISSGDVLRNIAPLHPDPIAPKADVPDIICFTPGTFIATPIGPRKVEDLSIDDLVITADNGLQPVRWIGSKRITGARLQAYPALRPIRIRKDALGHGLPERDMWVSPQHRMLICSSEFQPVFAQNEILVPAAGLLNDRTITVDYGLSTTRYIHLMFDQHEIIFANGAPTESFLASPSALAALDPLARGEVFDMFPELIDSRSAQGPAARKTLQAKDTRLVANAALP